MTTSTLPPVRSDTLSELEDAAEVWLDWSEAASPAVMRAPRIQQPAYIYRGSSASHLDGQGCDLVEPDDKEPDVRGVIFSCGCVARVPCHRFVPADIHSPRTAAARDFGQPRNPSFTFGH